MSKRARKERQSGTVRWDEDGAAHFCGGEGAPWVPMSMHLEHRQKLSKACHKLGREQETVIFFAGGKGRPMYDSDVEWDLFRQESNFQYLFGVKEPDCLGFVRVSDGKSVLLIPRLDKAYEIVMGPVKPPAWFHRAYEVDEVDFIDNVKEVLRGLGAKRLLTFRGTNRDSGLELEVPTFEGIGDFEVNEDACKAFWDIANETRVVKTAGEIRVMQYVNDVSSLAHLQVMRMIKGSQRESLSETTFRYHASLRACHRVGYNCICPAGPRNAILHYGHPSEPNAEVVEADALSLHDMGCEYHCYTADVTTTFPVNGTFTEPQRVVYEAVWAATLAVEKHVKPGVCYKAMHRLAQLTLLKEMTTAGLFKGDVEAMMAVDLAGRFMPHGLGHSVGLDVHDVGGYAPGTFRQDDTKMKQNLRFGRELFENAVVTVEPGFYFIDYLLDALAASPEQMKFVNSARLEELKPVGGVRIEDDIVITATGCRVLTCLPRTVSDIEGFMAGQDWVVSQPNCREYVAK